MDDDQNPIKLSRTGVSGSGLVNVLVVIAIVFVAVAFLKPWDLVAGPAKPRAPTAPDRDTTAREAPASPASSDRAAPGTEMSSGERSWQCYYAGGWRVFAVTNTVQEASQPQASPDPGTRSAFLTPSRTWMVIDPASNASGPADADIPFVRLVSADVTALGYCAPPRDDQPPADIHVTAWVLGGRTLASSFRLVPATGYDSTGDSTEGLYAPPARTGATVRTWPVGRYVFRISGRVPSNYQRWYGVEIAPGPGTSALGAVSG